MRVRQLHPWQISPREAIAIQRSLAAQVVKTGHLGSVKYVAGADVSTEKNSSLAYAGVVVMSFPGLELVEEQGIVFELSFPYIPGLLAFREAPPLLKVFEKIEHEPDLILFDGQGIAHPRGMGIASHAGIILDKPSIGCAKSLLFGHFEEPGVEQGSFSYLYAPASGSAGDRAGRGGIGGSALSGPHGPPHLIDDHNRVIGAVVRTRTGIQPVFVSIGHRIDLMTAIQFVLACSCGYRIPDPIRQAHHFENRLRRSQGQIRSQLSLLDSATR